MENKFMTPNKDYLNKIKVLVNNKNNKLYNLWKKTIGNLKI